MKANRLIGLMFAFAAAASSPPSSAQEPFHYAEIPVHGGPKPDCKFARNINAYEKILRNHGWQGSCRPEDPVNFRNNAALVIFLPEKKTYYGAKRLNSEAVSIYFKKYPDSNSTTVLVIKVPTTYLLASWCKIFADVEDEEPKTQIAAKATYSFSIDSATADELAKPDETNKANQDDEDAGSDVDDTEAPAGNDYGVFHPAAEKPGIPK